MEPRLRLSERAAAHVPPQDKASLPAYLRFVRQHRTILQLGIILLVAAVLRLNQITQPFIDGFSWRQVSVAMIAENFHSKDGNIFYPEVNWSGPGPSYQGREFQTVSYLAALLYTMTGQQDWVGRSIAVVFGLWGIFALYQLVRRIWDEERAIMSAAVMALLPGSVVVDRSFLPDPAMVALVVTSCWMFVAYLQTDRSRYLVLATLVGTWAFCTKITGLIVGLPLIYATLIVLSRKELLRPTRLVALGVYAIVTLGSVAAYYLWARHLSLSYPPYHFAGDGNWLWHRGVQQWLNEAYFFPVAGALFKEWFWTIPIIFLVWVGLVLRPPMHTPLDKLASDRKHGQRARTPHWFFHWWLLAGLIFYSFGAQELVSNPWNFHVVNPAAAALVAHAIITIATGTARFTRPALMLPVAALLLCTIALFGYQGERSISRPFAQEGYRLGLALYTVSQPGDLVVTVGSNFGDPVPIYYSQRRGWGFPPASPDYDWTTLPKDDTISIRWLEGLREQGADWFGIVPEHYQEIMQEHPLLARYIEHTCELKQNTESGAIYRMLRPEELARQLGSNSIHVILAPGTSR